MTNKLTLITTDLTKPEMRKPKMEAMPPAAPPHSTPLYRKLSSLTLVDHVGMVHNALDAVRCLIIPSSGLGMTPGGYPEDLSAVGRNQLVDLLEIINDRLGAALEMKEAA